MKRVNNIYKKINDVDVIIDMYEQVISKTTKNKNKIRNFDDYYSCNIINIKNIINSCNYTPNKYRIFFIREPKLRIIMSGSIEDKIINHLVAKYFLINVFDKTLINENCATRCGKGTHYALSLFKKYLNIYKNKHKEFYILKFDISKYFYNIDHDIVKELIRKKIKDKNVLKIIDTIIDSTDKSYVNDVIKKLKDNEIKRIERLNISDKSKKVMIDEVINLPFYEKGKGLCIGNMTSQAIATFYLNELDHYVKEDLGIDGYIRYMDDGILISDDKNYLNSCLNKINNILNKYKLKLNKKTKIYSSREEIEFLGFRFFISDKIYMKLTNKTKKRFKKKINVVYRDYMTGLTNYNNVLSIRNSYLAHLSYENCFNIILNNIYYIEYLLFILYIKKYEILMF